MKKFDPKIYKELIAKGRFGNEPDVKKMLDMIVDHEIRIRNMEKRK